MLHSWKNRVHSRVIFPASGYYLHPCLQRYFFFSVYCECCELLGHYKKQLFITGGVFIMVTGMSGVQFYLFSHKWFTKLNECKVGVWFLNHKYDYRHYHTQVIISDWDWDRDRDRLRQSGHFFLNQKGTFGNQEGNWLLDADWTFLLFAATITYIQIRQHNIPLPIN